MSGALAELLARPGVILADGATGTVLFDAGLPPGEAPELWNETRPEIVRNLHRGFAAAGADVILTNSFGSNRERLRLHGREGDAFEISRSAAAIARAEADRLDPALVVAGSVGPTGEILEPAGTFPFGSAVSAFEEQGRGLMQGGADVLWGETLSSLEEASAFALAASRLDAPFTVTLSFDTAGRTMMGLRPQDFGAEAAKFPSRPLAIGANCGTGASDLLAAILAFADAQSDIPLIAKANAGIPKFVGDEIRYDGTPALMGRYAVLARNAGARIVGGCCGTSADHLASMRRALAGAPPAPPPTLDEICAEVGPFIQRPASAEQRERPRRRRRVA